MGPEPSQYPSINDEVHLVTEIDLNKIYGTIDKGHVAVGKLAAAESISVSIDLDRLVTRHSAVLGSTGSGKSTTVSSLIRSISGKNSGENLFPSARILVLDIHGEYTRALADVAKIYRINPDEGESDLYVPYWALDIVDLLNFLMGKTEERAFTSILDKILSEKIAVSNKEKFSGVDLNSLTSESPIPFSLNKLWFDLIDPEIKTWKDAGKSQSAISKEGNIDSLTPPKYPIHGAGNTPPFINTENVLSIRRQLSLLRSRLLDHRYDFMLHPGDWEPDSNGNTKRDLPDLLEDWMGHDKPITILDLSDVPSSIISRLIGGILNIIYEGLYWGRNLPAGGRQRPQLIVMEEAHRYLGSSSDGLARASVQRIVKEGRKFGVGAMIVSQRPHEIDDTILSQCGTFFALRLSNANDRSTVQSALPDSLKGLVESLPILRTGEAIIIGEAAKLPTRCRISLPGEEMRPQSEDPLVSAAWSKQRSKDDYSPIAAAWRAQNAKLKH